MSNLSPSKAAELIKKAIQNKVTGNGGGSIVTGSSVLKQLAEASAKAVGLEPSAVTMTKYERDYPGARFEIANVRFWVIQKSAHLKVLYETLATGAQRASTTMVLEQTMPEASKEEGAGASTSKKK